MKPIQFILISLIALLGITSSLAQNNNDLWSDEAIQKNADAMLKELMQSTQATYDQAYQENMNASEKIIADAEIYRQNLEQELITTYQATVDQIYKQVMEELDNSCNPEKLYEEIYKEIMAQATQTYINAYAQGIAKPAAYTTNALNSLGGASQSSAFSHGLSMSIIQRYPAGNGDIWVKKRY